MTNKKSDVWKWSSSVFQHLKPPIRNCRSVGALAQSTLLTDEMRTRLRDWLPGMPRRLLFKAKRNGFLSRNFHKHCNGQGATVTVVQCAENGVVFGGYTPCVWRSEFHWSKVLCYLYISNCIQRKFFLSERFFSINYSNGLFLIFEGYLVEQKVFWFFYLLA